MGMIEPFEPEKLVVGLMYTDEALCTQALAGLEALYGPTDSRTEPYSFSAFSPYYDAEMGGEVFKRLFSFRDCVDPQTLAAIKRRSNALEEALAGASGRRVNIDPCLLGHGRFLMATTKPARFRVPLRDGIYADLALVYSRGHWEHFFWTYFDVKSEPVKAYLQKVREIYLRQRRAGF